MTTDCMADMDTKRRGPIYAEYTSKYEHCSSYLCFCVSGLPNSPVREGNVALNAAPNPFLCNLCLIRICLNQVTLAFKPILLHRVHRIGLGAAQSAALPPSRNLSSIDVIISIYTCI